MEQPTNNSLRQLINTSTLTSISITVVLLIGLLVVGLPNNIAEYTLFGVLFSLPILFGLIGYIDYKQQKYLSKIQSGDSVNQ